MKELIEKILLQEIEAVRELLKNPIDWKAESKHPWWPPLNAATIKGNFEIVTLLLENIGCSEKHGSSYLSFHKSDQEESAAFIDLDF
jgi:hypothetical protein